MLAICDCTNNWWLEVSHKTNFLDRRLISLTVAFDVFGKRLIDRGGVSVIDDFAECDPRGAALSNNWNQPPLCIMLSFSFMHWTQMMWMDSVIKRFEFNEENNLDKIRPSPHSRKITWENLSRYPYEIINALQFYLTQLQLQKYK